ncbi:hypothetical protein ScPMuIL_017086 [Solemya velum]
MYHHWVLVSGCLPPCLSVPGSSSAHSPRVFPPQEKYSQVQHGQHFTLAAKMRLSMWVWNKSLSKNCREHSMR